MARQSNVIASVDQAFAEASSRIFAEALTHLPANTSIGSLVDQFDASEYRDIFRELSVADLVASVGGKSAKRGRPAGSTSRSSGGRSKKVNTRTQSGREALDATVTETLSGAGEATMEEIRKIVGGSANQVRQSLARLREDGKVKVTGQKRATRYHWKGRK